MHRRLSNNCTSVQRQADAYRLGGPRNRGRAIERGIGGLTSAALMLAAWTLFAAPAFAGCNSGNVPDTDLLSNFACQSSAPGTQATAVGSLATASGGGSSAYGNNSNASGGASSAYGVSSTSSAEESSAYGARSVASADFTSAFGSQSTASGANASAYGAQSTASGLRSTAVGDLSTASGDFSIAMGRRSIASGNESTAVGHLSLASGFASTALGGGPTAATSARATGENSTAVGTTSLASGLNATAIGANSSAAFANSTAIGNGATATAANQMAFGTASNTYRMPGIASAASLAAQTGPASFVTTDANGNLATSSFNPQSITTLQSQVSVLQSQVGDLRTEARRGIAAAVAIASPGMPSAPGKTTWQVRGSMFQGEYGVGAGFQHRLNTAVPLSIVGGYGNGGGREHTAYIGLGGEF